MGPSLADIVDGYRSGGLFGVRSGLAVADSVVISLHWRGGRETPVEAIHCRSTIGNMSARSRFFLTT